MRHWSNYKVLSDAQHGFRKFRSCDTQLLLTIHDLASSIEEKDQTDLISLDFSRRLTIKFPIICCSIRSSIMELGVNCFAESRIS